MAPWRRLGAATGGLSQSVAAAAVEEGTSRGQHQTGSAGPEVNVPFISLRGTGHVVSWHPGVLRHAINWRVTFELLAISGVGTCDSG